MHVVTAGMHHTGLDAIVDGAFGRLEGHVDEFGHWERVHIGTQRDDRAGATTLEHAHDAVAAHAGPDLEAE